MINDIKILLNGADAMINTYIGRLHKQLHLAELDYMYRKMDKPTYLRIESELRCEMSKLCDMQSNLDRSRYIADKINEEVGYETNKIL